MHCGPVYLARNELVGDNFEARSFRSRRGIFAGYRRW